MGDVTPRWMFYHDGVYGECDERVLREFADSYRHLSGELGICYTVMRQLWDEIDRLRAELEPAPKNYASFSVSRTDA